MTTETQYKYTKPLPEMDPEDKPYWVNVHEHAMKVQRCESCGTWHFPPRPICAKCQSDKLVWTKVSGRGRVYASTNQYHAFLPSYTKDDMPYNVSIIELDEGVRMITNVIGCPVDQVKIGMAVEVVYDDVTPEITLAKWRPIKAG
jgi:hypothetical protein